MASTMFRPVLCAVASIHRCRQARVSSGSDSISPMTVTRTLLRSISGVSFSIALAIRCISMSTSYCGRFQFSVEKV